MDPRLPAVAEQLLVVERELRVQGFWQLVQPAPEALASEEPFCVDTLSFEQWLQWVFLPRMKVIVESGQPLPRASGIHAMAQMALAERLERLGGLLAALERFDSLIGGEA